MTKDSTELVLVRIILLCVWPVNPGNSQQLRNARRIAKNATWVTFLKLPGPPLNVNPALPVTAKKSLRNQIVHPAYVDLYCCFFVHDSKLTLFVF